MAARVAGPREGPMDARILLVEDDPSIREVTAIGLRNAGFTVETADDGAVGLERFAAEPFDLVLLDGCRGTFAISLAWAIDKSQWGTLRVYDRSAKDGTPENTRDYPVWLVPTD